MQKDTADGRSVCPGEAAEYILPCFCEYRCKHTESLYKLMATDEQMISFLSLLLRKRDWK